MAAAQSNWRWWSRLRVRAARHRRTQGAHVRLAPAGQQCGSGHDAGNRVLEGLVLWDFGASAQDGEVDHGVDGEGSNLFDRDGRTWPTVAAVVAGPWLTALGVLAGAEVGSSTASVCRLAVATAVSHAAATTPNVALHASCHGRWYRVGVHSLCRLFPRPRRAGPRCESTWVALTAVSGTKAPPCVRCLCCSDLLNASDIDIWYVHITYA